MPSADTLDRAFIEFGERLSEEWVDIIVEDGRALDPGEIEYQIVGPTGVLVGPQFGGEFAPERFIREGGVFCWQPAVWANYSPERVAAAHRDDHVPAGAHRRPHSAGWSSRFHQAKHRRK